MIKYILLILTFFFVFPSIVLGQNIDLNQVETLEINPSDPFSQRNQILCLQVNITKVTNQNGSLHFEFQEILDGVNQQISITPGQYTVSFPKAQSAPSLPGFSSTTQLVPVGPFLVPVQGISAQQFLGLFTSPSTKESGYAEIKYNPRLQFVGSATTRNPISVSDTPIGYTIQCPEVTQRINITQGGSDLKFLTQTETKTKKEQEEQQQIQVQPPAQTNTQTQVPQQTNTQAKAAITPCVANYKGLVLAYVPDFNKCPESTFCYSAETNFGTAAPVYACHSDTQKKQCIKDGETFDPRIHLICTKGAGIHCGPVETELPDGTKVPVTSSINYKGVMTAIGCVPSEPSTLIERLLVIAAIAGGGVALLLMIFGALQMVTSAGNPDTLKKGQDQFKASIIGLIFILFSLVLLQIIGVDILDLPGFGR